MIITDQTGVGTGFEIDSPKNRVTTKISGANGTFIAIIPYQIKESISYQKL